MARSGTVLVTGATVINWLRKAMPVTGADMSAQRTSLKAYVESRWSPRSGRDIRHTLSAVSSKGTTLIERTPHTTYALPARRGRRTPDAGANASTRPETRPGLIGQRPRTPALRPRQIPGPDGVSPGHGLRRVQAPDARSLRSNPVEALCATGGEVGHGGYTTGAKLCAKLRPGAVRWTILVLESVLPALGRDE